MNNLKTTAFDKEKSARTLVHVIYLLQALAFINGFTAIIAVIINYVKLDDVKGSWLESHFRWQIRTFWFALLWLVIGLLTMVIMVGFILLFVNVIWVIYRIVKGWLYLNDGKAIN